MERVCVLFLAGLFILGCSPKVRFESTKPIKIDVTMRVDVYQHIAKQADDIESQIESGTTPDKQEAKPQSRLWTLGLAYAQEELSGSVQAAVNSRKARRSELLERETKGIIGENYKGLVELRGSPASEADSAKVNEIIPAENADRLVIYNELSKSAGTSVEDYGIVYAKRIQEGAASGTPIQINVDGKLQWTIKK